MTTTALNSRTRISKDSTAIEFRGRLDSLNAQIIFLQTLSTNQEYISDLEELRMIIRKLQQCEACNTVFEGEFVLWGMPAEELHVRSHNPAKFCGRGHILPHRDMKHEAAGLNLIRTLIREAEVSACRAYDTNDTLRIIHTLNRLSSAVYVLTYKYLPKDFSYELSFRNALT